MTTEEVQAGLRTVTHLSVYFEELKQAGRGLAERIPPQERGYFTPDEEDETRALLVSYWQSRNALLELITTLRSQEADFSEEERPLAFLTAFTAALLLVDAARFLRETAHAHPVVREKLNEPAESFGVPGGAYDSIQRSLLGARHAWHLYHAVQYFDEHEPQLRALAAQEDVEPLIVTVDRLKHRLDVSVARFARTRLRMRGSQLFTRLRHNLMGRSLYGLQKLCGNIASDKYVRPGHHPQLPDRIADELRNLLVPGDVVMARKEYALTNYFLPGFWPHAALYLGDAEALDRLGISQHDAVRARWKQLAEERRGESRKVLEAMKDGVRIRSLASPLASDSFVVLRPRVETEQLAEALCRGLAHEGKQYDFDFDFRRSDRLVCTEVVYRSYDGVGPVNFELIHRAGRPTLSGSDLIRMALAHTHFDAVAAFVPGRHPEIVAAPDVDELIRSCDPHT